MQAQIRQRQVKHQIHRKQTMDGALRNNSNKSDRLVFSIYITFVRILVKTHKLLN